MAIFIKNLAAGTLIGPGTTKVYKVPVGSSAMIKNIRLVNGLANIPTTVLNLLVRPYGSTQPRLICPRNFTIEANGSLVIDDVLTLGAGDELEIVLASGGQELAYVISGVEKE